MEPRSSATPHYRTPVASRVATGPEVAPVSIAAPDAAIPLVNKEPGDLAVTSTGTGSNGSETSGRQSMVDCDPSASKWSKPIEVAKASSLGASEGGEAIEGAIRSRSDCPYEIQVDAPAGQGLATSYDGPDPGLDKGGSLPGTVDISESTSRLAPGPQSAAAGTIAPPADAARPARRSRDLTRVVNQPLAFDNLQQVPAKRDTFEVLIDERVPSIPSVATSTSPSGESNECGAESAASTSGTAATQTPRHRQRSAPVEAGRRTALPGHYSRAAAPRPLRVVRALVKKATGMLRVLTGRKKEGASIQDYRLHKVVGQGAFGVVHLCTKKGRPGTLYALKSMDKKDLLARQETEQALAKKDALMALSGHPFIVKTYKTFQDQLRLYFVMEFVAGGDLFDQLERHHKLSADQTRFYAAEIAVALEYMHSKNFLYRDLKIENVMLDTAGHVKLTDLGFSRRCLPGERRYTFVGTPDYLAPEIVNGKGHDKAVDFWAYGVLLFELMAGCPPFFGDNPKELYRRIAEGDFRFPSPVEPGEKGIPKLARDLLQGLLEVDPARRLGSGPAGWGDVKAHPWFAGVAWDAVAKRALTPPLVPPVYHHRKPAKYLDYLEVYRWHASPSGGLVLAGAASGGRVHPDPTPTAGTSSPQSSSNVFGAF